MRAEPRWLPVVEVLLVVVLLAGWRLLRVLATPSDIVRTGADLLREHDFTTQFREVGQPEVDALVRLYNELAAALRAERVRHEEQHLFLEKLIAASPAAILVADADGRISHANPAAARLLEAPTAELVGKRPAELATPLAAGIAALPAQGSTVLALRGSRRVRVLRGEFFDLGARRDFYLLEELTEELRASERAAYDRLVRLVAHEVNNSVGAVRSLLDSFATYGTHLPDADRGDFVDGLGVAARRLENLARFVAGFAEVVRLPAPERRPCDLAALVDDLLVLMRPGFEARRIRSELRVDPALARGGAGAVVLADKNQLEQVLVNVLKNAAEAIGDDGTVTVELGRTVPAAGGGERRLFLAVRDTGPGIAPDAVERLFTPFYTTRPGGRGLGLTLAQEILDAHSFAYRLENRAEGGAEFRIEM